MRGLVLLMATAGVSAALAQSPQADFSLPATACRSENIMPVNNSTGASSYEWDVCQGDLGLVPGGSVPNSISSSSVPTGIDIVFDGANWYGFVTSRGDHTIIRILLGPDLSTFAVDGTIGPLPQLRGPDDISMVNDNGNWYGFVVNENDPKDIVRLDFGSSITSSPTATVVTTSAGVGNQGLDVVRSAGAWFIVQSNGTSVRTIRLSTITSFPTAGDMVTTAVASGNLSDVKVLETNGNFFVYAAEMSAAKLYRLAYGANLNASPTVSDITVPGISASFGIDGGFDGGTFYLMQSTLDGTLVRVNLGNDLGQPPVQVSSLGGFFGNTVKSRLVKHRSSWHSFATDFSNKRVFKASFPSPACEIFPSVITDTSPILVYSTAGTKGISLRARNGGMYDDAHGTVTVSALTSPTIDFNYQDICATFATQFTLDVPETPATVFWDFGDGTNDNQPDPSKTYAAAGAYTVLVTAQFGNGCNNTARQQVSIFNKPVPSFVIPPAAPYCTNHTYTVNNTTVFDLGSNPSWEWQVNSLVVSTQEDLDALFFNPTAQDIKLIAAIPGCSAEVSQNIPSVTVGPLIAFIGNDDCLGNTVQFVNSSSGADLGFVWDFGDGTPTSNQPQPSHDYAAIGTYPVTLSGSNSGGCTNFMIVDLTIYSVPQPDFSVGLPPFSCSNTPTLFQNNTPDLTDSNISDWFWEFGDPSNSTADVRDPSFTYTTGANYSVKLTATSDAGCTNNITKLIAIGTSPDADFINGPACVNQLTQFSDISTGGVTTRSWQVGGAVLSGPSPTHTFTVPGSYNVTLTVTGSGGCNDLITKPVDVPVLQTLVLDVDNPCADQPTTFTLLNNTSPAFLDNVIGWQWNIAGTATSGNPVTESVTLAGPSPVSVTTTHQSGCVYTKMETVTIHSSPVADFTATPQQGNAPLTVQFQNNATGATQYQWLFTGDPPGLSTEVSPVHTFLELGDYTAQLTAINANGCEDTKTVPIQVLVPTLDLALTQFTLAPDGLTGKLRPSVTVKNNSNVPVTTVEIAIHLSNQATVTEPIAVDLAVGESATHALTITLDPVLFATTFVCAEVLSEKDVTKADNRQCISFEESDFVFDPYPNPSAGMLYVDWVATKQGTATVTIYNSQGRREYSWETPSAIGLNQSVHDVSFLASGMYVVTVQTSSTVQSRRFVR